MAYTFTPTEGPGPRKGRDRVREMQCWIQPDGASLILARAYLFCRICAAVLTADRRHFGLCSDCATTDDGHAQR